MYTPSSGECCIVSAVLKKIGNMAPMIKAKPHPPPAPFPAHQYLHLQHTADILSKQATELAQAKSEVMTLRSQRQREVGELEERLREMEVKYATETTSLTATRKCQQEEHRLQVGIPVA